ncbi:hypothetical protein SVIOM342S_07064 [Streptomyces violaceorubidus]
MDRNLVQKGDAPPSKGAIRGTEFCVDIVVKGRKTEVPSGSGSTWPRS